MTTIDDGTGDDCSQCGTRQNAASNMTNTVFQVNTDQKCGHKFCGNCIHDIFVNQGKRQFACKVCTALGRSCIVKKERLSVKSLEETEAERDVRVRRRIKGIFNKTEEDFATMDEYRDYDEEVEDIIYNLVHDIDVAETNVKIEKYRKENEETIFFNQSKIMESRGEMDRKIQAQNENLQSKLQEAHEATMKERLYKKEHAKQVNEMMLGERDSVNMQAFSAAPAAVTAADPGPPVGFNPAQYAPNHIYSLLHPRELPKPLGVAVAKKPLSNAEKRAAHAAGGFDERNRWRKNWAEIVSHPFFQSHMKVDGEKSLAWDF